MEKHNVNAGQDGFRLDAFLACFQMSRSQGAALAEQGRVTVNKVLAKKNHKLHQGDVVEYTPLELREMSIAPQKLELDVVYEDASVIVVNKPKGMVVHPAPGNPDNTLVNGLLDRCKGQLSGIGGVARPGIVHRIDKETSGLLIVAKNDKAHQSLSAQLKDRSLSRTYYALVKGGIKLDFGTINAPIGRSTKDRKKMAVVEGGRTAVTHYEVVERYIGYTLVRCKLETGRTHQIRVHLAYLGHPVAGDRVYGLKNDKSGIDGQALHAAELRFVHPDSGELVVVEAPLPSYFKEFIDKMRDI